MYIVYEAPLQMLSDSPSSYRRDPDCTRFMAQMPTTWDETRVLAGEVGKYILIARRHGNRWFVAAMTNSERRELTVDLSFLGAGTWKLEYIKDGVNAARNATDYHLGNAAVSQRDVLGLTLAPGGGWAGVLSPQENGRTKRAVAK
jgi:alpha-glucosidase